MLAYLSRHEGRNQAALADILEIQPISLVRLLDRMVAAGWIERRHCPTDRRAYQLFLTPAAAPVMEQIRAIGTTIDERALAGLAVQQRELLTDLLLQVRGNLQNATMPAADTLDAGPAICSDVVVSDVVV